MKSHRILWILACLTGLLVPVPAADQPSSVVATQGPKGNGTPALLPGVKSDVDYVLSPQDQLKLLTQEAFDGNAQAQLELAVMYEERDSLENAYRWFTKSAGQGIADAQYKLGVFHALGLGGAERDAAKAVRWFQKAAEQGMVGAQYNLAVCLENGQGTQRDLAKAREWYEKAARQKDPYAQKALGVIYERGLGVEADPQEAFAWYHLAAELKNEEAIALRRLLSPHLKPIQVSDGRRRADDLAREIYGASLATMNMPTPKAEPIKDFLE